MFHAKTPHLMQAATRITYPLQASKYAACRCACALDGLAGRTCEDPTEMFCNNQCSGRGDCWLGFCRCHPGWWGHDCAHRDSSIALPAQAGASSLHRSGGSTTIEVSPLELAVPLGRCESCSGGCPDHQYCSCIATAQSLQAWLQAQRAQPIPVAAFS